MTSNNFPFVRVLKLTKEDGLMVNFGQIIFLPLHEVK